MIPFMMKNLERRLIARDCASSGIPIRRAGKKDAGCCWRGPDAVEA